MKPLFRPNYWGRLSQFEVPHSIFEKQQLVISPSALTMLLILLQIAKSKQSRNREPFIDVKVTQRRLNERSCFSKNIITKAMKELEQRSFIKIINQRSKRGEFGASSYLLCNPLDGEPLQSIGSNFLYGNRVRYFRLPSCITMQSSARWSLAAMSSSEIRLYVALCWLANKHKGNTFSVDVSDLKMLTSFSRLATLRKGIEELNRKNLVWATLSENGDELDVALCDPFTGEPLYEQTGTAEDDPANYYVTPNKGRATRVNLNAGGPEHVESVVRSCLADEARVIAQKNGDLMICCPFHADSTPSCSVSPAKRCFHCFGCHKRGTATQLVAKLRGTGNGDAFRYMATHLGQTVEFHRPTNEAEAIYEYRDETGKVLKQVLRHADKKFSQRRPFKNGWVWDTVGVRPSLYNLDRLQFSWTVCFCEGEKDCDTITRLRLTDPQGHEIFGVTSGGSDTWKDELADCLKGKKVVLMPDADEPGMRFASEVAHSLQERAIEYCQITFSDCGAKDISEFLERGGTVEDLVRRIGQDWISGPATHAATDELTEPIAP